MKTKHLSLFTLTSKYDQLEEDWARFYTMEAVLASLHSRNYVHWDLTDTSLPPSLSPTTLTITPHLSLYP